MGQIASGFPVTHHQEPFSRREIEILSLIHRGLSNDEIAHQLYLSPETVKWYNKQIYGKLGVSSRTQAVARARDVGLIEAWAAAPVQAHPRPKHNLPVPLNATIGRQQELADLRLLLAGETIRLVTLVGFGGVGKTRLALEAAAQVVEAYPQGVWWVSLAPLADGKLVAGAIAALFGLQQEKDRPIQAVLQDYLRSRRLLLALDNCEHLLDACARLIEDLLRACPELHILATSRETLGCAGETVYPVAALSLPQAGSKHSLEELSNLDAVQLLMTRAKAIAPTFALSEANAPSIAHICRKLDGIPLALELAAARLNVLSVEQIAARLEQNFGVLASFSRTSLPRHQTLQACLDWSYDLLSEPERTLLRRLTVFTGGCTLEAAEAVCSDEELPAAEVLDMLTRLVQKSLVAVNPQPGCEPRYHLHEIIRQYAGEKLACEKLTSEKFASEKLASERLASKKLVETGETDRLQEKHLDYFLDYMAKAAPKFLSAERLAIYPRCYADLDNFRRALHWALDEREHGRAEDGLRLAVYLMDIWELKGLFAEDYAWLAKGMVLMEASGAPWTALRAAALNAFGHVAGFLGRRQEYIETLRESIALYRTCDDPGGLILALINSGMFNPGFELVEGRAALDEAAALCREYGYPFLLADALFFRGRQAYIDQDYDLASVQLQESLTLCRILGDEVQAGYALLFLAIISFKQGKIESARMLLEEFVPISMKDIDRLLDILAWHEVVEIAYALGDFRLIETFYREKQAAYHILGYPNIIEYAHRCIGMAARHLGDTIQAVDSFRQALSLAQSRKNQESACNALAGLAGAALDRGQPGHAARLLGALEPMIAAFHEPVEPIWQQEFDRDVAAAKAALSPEEFARAWGEGQKLTLEQAVAYAWEALTVSEVTASPGK